MKVCNKCKKEKEFSEFHKNKIRKDGYQNYCKDCNSKYSRNWYKKECNISYSREYYEKNKDIILEKIRQYQIDNREKRNKLSRKYYNKNDIKKIARWKLREAIKAGKIIKPNKCEHNNSECMGQIEGHHKDYNKPLEVNWLCKKCHTKKTF